MSVCLATYNPDDLCEECRLTLPLRLASLVHMTRFNPAELPHVSGDCTACKDDGVVLSNHVSPCSMGTSPHDMSGLSVSVMFVRPVCAGTRDVSFVVRNFPAPHSILVVGADTHQGNSTIFTVPMYWAMQLVGRTCELALPLSKEPVAQRCVIRPPVHLFARVWAYELEPIFQTVM